MSTTATPCFVKSLKGFQSLEHTLFQSELESGTRTGDTTWYTQFTDRLS